jgi:hypothetical protein
MGSFCFDVKQIGMQMAESQVTAWTDMPVCEMVRSGQKDLHYSLIPLELSVYFVFVKAWKESILRKDSLINL